MNYGYFGSSHDKWRLEGELIPQQDIKIEFLNGLVHVGTIHCCLINLQLYIFEFAEWLHIGVYQEQSLFYQACIL